MNDQAFRELLDLIMVSDPVPLTALKGEADRYARQRGYSEWVDAYHRFRVGEPTPIKRKRNWDGSYRCPTGEHKPSECPGDHGK